jgi:hypothetical protein
MQGQLLFVEASLFLCEITISGHVKHWLFELPLHVLHETSQVPHNSTLFSKNPIAQKQDPLEGVEIRLLTTEHVIHSLDPGPLHVEHE